MSKPAKNKKSKQSTVQPAVPLAPEVQKTPTQNKQDINTINERLANLTFEVKNAIDTLQFAYAKQLLENEVLPYASEHPVALNDLAVCEKSLGNHEQAYRLASHALNFAQTDHLPDIYDNLASICHKLNRFEESKHFGRLAIFIKKEMVKDIVPNALPKRKKKGLSADKSKNIIAFSLTGNIPSQCETAVLNASLASQLYPNWTCRFYVDNSVPDHVFNRLTQHNAEIVHTTFDPAVPAILRHFTVMADKEVHAFLIRDTNSLLSYKEMAAVEAWLESKQNFHLIRDFYEHTELVLPTLWAGYTGAFDDIESQMITFFTENGIGRNSILGFLRTKIYPTIAQSLMIHDDLHLDPDSYAYPRYPLSDVEKIPFFHIGLSDSYVRTTSIYLEEPANAIEWCIANPQDQIVCYYTSTPTLVDGKPTVVLNLPYFYSEHFASGHWNIRYRTIN